MQTRTKESRKRLQSLILLTAFTCVLLIVSTYAWFTFQKDVSVTNIKAKVKVADGLQISLDAATWTQELDLTTDNAAMVADLIKQKGETVTRNGADATVVYGSYEGNTNHVPVEFLPVSTSGEINGKDLVFMDGSFENNELKGIRICDDRKENNTEGYFAFDVFLKNLSSGPEKEEVLQLNSDSSAWVLRDGDKIVDDQGTEYTGDKGAGLQNAVRVAFARYISEDVKITHTASEIRDFLNAENISSVAIWEPNADAHVQRIIDNIPQLFIGDSKPTIDKTKGNELFFTRTLKKPTGTMNTENNTYEDATVSVFDWNDSNTKLAKPSEVQTVQTTSTEDFGYYITEGVQNLKTITGSEFKIPVNTIIKLRLYVYVEGQDPDCDNDASLAGGLEFNIGMTKETDLEDITARPDPSVTPPVTPAPEPTE